MWGIVGYQDVSVAGKVVLGVSDVSLGYHTFDWC